MAEVARAKGTEVEVATFEGWDDAGRRFDLLVSAPGVALGRPPRPARPRRRPSCARGATIGLFWNLNEPEPAAREAFTAVYERREPHLATASVLLGGRWDRLDLAKRALQAAREFAVVEQWGWSWECRYTTAEWLDHIGDPQRPPGPGTRAP